MTYSNTWSASDDTPQAPVTTSSSVINPSSNNPVQASSSPAQDPSLANTGIDSTNGIMFLLGGLSLALIGAEMLMIARRKRSN
jgi:LPXTG-motif cell wall-anchored protein